MIIKALALREDGAAVLPGYASALQLGYAGNCGLYAVKATLQGAWQGLTVLVVWHIPGGIAAPTTLLQDQQCAVPAEVTAAAGRGVATFEGTDGHGVTVVSADVPYLVGANSGTADGVAPEPGTTAWDEFVRQAYNLATDEEVDSMLDEIFNEAKARKD